MKIKKLTIMKCIFEIILLFIISFLYYLNQPIKTPQLLFIEQGSINRIIAQMQSKHYDVSKLDSFFLRFFGSPQSGWINIGTHLNTKADFLYKITHEKAALENITLIPGETTYIFLHQLALQLHLDLKKLERAFKNKTPIMEGAFVSDTYSVPKGITEERLIYLLLKVSQSKRKALAMKLFGSYNATQWFRYVTIASIIQKESANNKEMPIVSSVIYNRIRKGMKLQMDGTLNYGKYSHQKVTPKRIKEDKSIYNTYLHKGIPPIPVCNVGFEAIRAAIFPAQTHFLYFMRNKKNSHNFSCNYSTHLLNIKRATK